MRVSHEYSTEMQNQFNTKLSTNKNVTSFISKLEPREREREREFWRCEKKETIDNNPGTSLDSHSPLSSPLLPSHSLLSPVIESNRVVVRSGPV
jgi:hypothetical protein